MLGRILGAGERDDHTYLQGDLRDSRAAVNSFMRTLVCAFVASLVVTGILPASARAGNPVDRVSEDKKHANEETVFVTGSLIPQRIKLKRIGTTTISPIRIIDRGEIDQTGRRTTRGILVADPSIRVTDH